LRNDRNVSKHVARLEFAFAPVTAGSGFLIEEDADGRSHAPRSSFQGSFFT